MTLDFCFNLASCKFLTNKLRREASWIFESLFWRKIRPVGPLSPEGAINFGGITRNCEGPYFGVPHHHFNRFRHPPFVRCRSCTCTVLEETHVLEQRGAHFLLREIGYSSACCHSWRKGTILVWIFTWNLRISTWKSKIIYQTFIQCSMYLYTKQVQVTKLWKLNEPRPWTKGTPSWTSIQHKMVCMKTLKWQIAEALSFWIINIHTPRSINSFKALQLIDVCPATCYIKFEGTPTM